DLRALDWLLCRLAALGLHQGICVMAAVPAHHEGHIESLSAEIDSPSVALIVVSVPGKKCVRVNSLRLADGVDVVQHRGVPAVVPARAAAPRWRLITERRMVGCEEYGALILLRLDAFQLGGQERQLHV